MIKETKTFIKLKNKPRVNFPKWIIVHHTGGTDANPLEDTSNHTAEIVENWHLQKGWDGIGYTYFINKDGTIWAGRPEYYTGAHAIGYNNQSIGICLAGNFDATMPTSGQIETLRLLLKEMMAKYNIPAENVVPHRKFATKTCYGNLLQDNWAKNLVLSPTPPLANKKETILKLLEDIKRQVSEL